MRYYYLDKDKVEGMKCSLEADSKSKKMIRLGFDIFVKQKEGSIGSHYNFGKVLG